MSDITPESAQRISALVDGQLRGQELAQVLHELGRDGQARAQWDAYHVIGQCLRAGDAGCQGADAGFVSHLSVRLKREVVALDPLPVIPLEVVQEPARPVVSANHGFWRKTVGLASFAVLAVVAWQGSVELLSTEPSGTVLATQTLPEKARNNLEPVPVSLTPELALLLRGDGTSVLTDQAEAAVMIRDPRLDAYLTAHRGYAGASALQVDPGFVQSATFEGARR